MKLRATILLSVFIKCATCLHAVGSTQELSFTAAVVPENNVEWSDIFFSVLSDTVNATLVEREEFQRLVQEAQLTSLAEATPVELGQITKADVLVLITKNSKQLFVRVVETLHGLRLFESVDSASAVGAEALALSVKKQLERRSRLLTAAASEREYVAVDPLVIKSSGNRNRYPEFSTVGDLLAVELSIRPNVVCVEREALKEVAFENALDDQVQVEHSKLTWADWLLGGVCEVRSKTEAGVSLRLQSLDDGATRYSPTFDVRVDTIDQSIKEMMRWIAGVMNINMNDSQRPNSLGEAETQFLLGRANRARGLRDRAIRCFRVAHMLAPKNAQYTQELATTLAGSIGERTDRLTKMQELIEAMDLCQYTLETKMCCFNDTYHQNTYPWAALPKFLQSVPKDLDAIDNDLVTRFRRRLRSYMEWLYGYRPGTRIDKGGPWLQVMSPFFFDEPGRAMAYMRELLRDGDFDWLRLSYSNFLAIRYWDRPRAKEIWQEFLCDIRDTRDGEAKYYAMRSIAMIHGGYSKDASPEGTSAVHDLFTWLAADPSRYGYIRHYMSREVWSGFAQMDIEFQRRYLGPLMMPRVLAPGEAAHNAVFQALDRVYAAYPNDLVVREEISGYLDAYLKRCAQNNSRTIHAGAVGLLTTSYPNLASLARTGNMSTTKGLTLYRDGVERIFDYLSDVPQEYRNGARAGLDLYTYCVDPPYFWITWCVVTKSRERHVCFIQCDMRSRASRFFTLPVTLRGMGGFDKLLVRWRDFLCLAGDHAVMVIPFEAMTGNLVIDQTKILKGLPPLGVGKHKVTCLVPSPDDIYIGATQGLLFRWNSNMESVEQVVGHNLLAPGPLNDTNPYKVVGGQHAKLSNSMEFHIESNRRSPKQGWWRYKPQTQTPWQWIAESDAKSGLILPAWRVNMRQGYVLQDLEFISKTGETVTVARVRSGKSKVSWCDRWAVWILQLDGGSPLEMYVVARDDWPDVSQQDHNGKQQTPTSASTATNQSAPFSVTD